MSKRNRRIWIDCHPVLVSEYRANGLVIDNHSIEKQQYDLAFFYDMVDPLMYSNHEILRPYDIDLTQTKNGTSWGQIFEAIHILR
jgi:hypothetical protein